MDCFRGCVAERLPSSSFQQHESRHVTSEAERVESEVSAAAIQAATALGLEGWLPTLNNCAPLAIEYELLVKWPWAQRQTTLEGPPHPVVGWSVDAWKVVCEQFKSAMTVGACGNEQVGKICH